MKGNENVYSKVERNFFSMILCILGILSLVLCTSGVAQFFKAPVGIFQKKPAVIFLWGWIFFFFLCTSLFLGIRMVRIQSDRVHKIYRMLLVILILLLQIICLTRVGKITLTTDSFKVADMASYMVSDSHGILDNAEQTRVLDGYFSRYGNNNFFAIILYYFFSFVKFFGCRHFIVAARIWNVIMIDMGIFLAYLSAKKMWGSRKADILLLFCALSPTTYLWLFWSYTNTFSIPFVMGILLVSLYSREAQKEKKLVLYGMGMAGIGIVGYFLRPTTIIPMIAVVIFQMFPLEKSRKYMKKTLFWLAGFVLVAAIGAGSMTMLKKQHLSDPECRGQFPITHWMMMGLSESGGYNRKDVAYTRQFPTKEEKKSADVKRIIQRLKQRNILEFGNFARKKLVRVYGDGEDDFTQQDAFQEDQTALYSYIYGEKNECLRLYCNIFRGIVLALIAILAFGSMRGRIRPICLYALTLFGSMLFFILWEANGKYNISFEYVMLLLAAGGLITLEEKIRFVMKQKKNEKYGKTVYQTAVICGIIGIVLTIVSFLLVWNDCTEKQYAYKVDAADLTYGKQNTVYDLSEHKVIEQTFRAAQPFNRVELFVKQKEVPSVAAYKISILDANGTTQREIVIDKDSPQLFAKKIKWSFSEMTPNQKTGETYTIRIEQAKSGNDFLAFHYFSYLAENKYESGTLKTDGEDGNADLCFRVYEKCQETYMPKYVYLLVAAIIVLFELAGIGTMMLKDFQQMQDKLKDSVK